MNHLPRVIGKAPSELTPAKFRIHLGKERERVNTEIEIFQNKIPAKQKAKAAKAVRKELDKVMLAKGLTPEMLQEMIKNKIEKEKSK